MNLKSVTSYVAILILVFGIIGTGTLRAELDSCEPLCSMHLPKVQQAACCVADGTEHSDLSLSGLEDKRDQLPCCDDNFCFDSPLEFRETALIPHSIDSMAPAPYPLSYLAINLAATQRKPPSQRYYPQKTIPVYMITCVYLI